MADNQARSSKKRFRSDGTSIWTRPKIDGPGVWITCVKGKERQAIGETYDLFERLVEELWPPAEDPIVNGDDVNESDEEDLEKAISKEVQNMKRPRKEKLFAACQTNTPCLVFISCKSPVDPVSLIALHMKRVDETGITHTRSTHRFTPISSSCDTNLPEIISLCKRVVLPVFEREEKRSSRYKLEVRMRYHNTLTRDEVIKVIAQCIPEEHKVDLENPDLFILVEIFKASRSRPSPATFGVSVVKDYYRYKKFNVVEVSQAKLARVDDTEG
ncbi:uncharacterized protein FOMMEDRAFT_152217 [Fomitiporia mediterranea MF3/22]|uniref:uncharacterized protein n=1 Tax=Fomitiporia mediterranea (strain MF3/22) TaxID=694068 RepID=UPI0004409CA1|nr:uncharacterized protein FOMMEDRAFT_152217 [Fomitiporia mediterranea MF3/22]EJD06890.1 hypothetical protein FOMMEDRAFT_152217 [Fomitiporia mediterranea MF3/22]